MNTTRSERDTDFFDWTQRNAELLRQGRLAEIDVEQIAEELDTMGRTARRELGSRLRLLLMHLLKWRYQPERRGSSWRLTIDNQRAEIDDLLAESPSLRAHLAEQMNRQYGVARRWASVETGLPLTDFSETCPYSLDDTLNPDFWPN